MEETSLFYTAAGLLIITSLLILIVLIYVLRIVRLLITAEQPATAPAASESLLAQLRRRFLTGDLKPIAQEQSILLDHNYDGIQELDHRMPPWLAYFFYGTVAFAIIYMASFWVLETVPTSEQEYVAEVAQAEAQLAEYKKTVAAGLDENTAKLVTDPKALETGKTLFAQNCQACHGGAGEGGVGPNLTDEYWLHGGEVNEIFKTIKFGITEKGMVAWNGKLSKDQILEVSSYILSLQGSNPAGAKEPQGEKVAK
ncbi:MAG: c-type cytochrome [Cytophagales bacterium]|nr:c-type cytochrome [Cytophagales bacterium]